LKSSDVRMAVVPAAGRGTRMAPATLVLPKELFPVGPCPMIQWALDEIAEAGIPRAAVVYSPSKPQIPEFVSKWKLGRGVRLTLVEQPKPRGLADALFRARAIVGAAPFALLLPDNVFFPSKGAPGATAQVLNAYAETGFDTCGLIRVSPKQASTFSHAGLVDPVSRPRGPVQIKRLHGKKKGPLRVKDTRPVYKTLARAVLTPHFFEYLQTNVKKDDEADEVPALQALVKRRELYGILLKGRGFDAGNPDGYAAAVEYWAHIGRQPTK
jgi:UTP--glucose-1-phosphate uridylyltransferase